MSKFKDTEAENKFDKFENKVSRKEYLIKKMSWSPSWCGSVD